MNTTDWLTAVAAAVQALAAVSIVVLTVALVKSTRRYTNATQEMLQEQRRVQAEAKIEIEESPDGNPGTLRRIDVVIANLSAVGIMLKDAQVTATLLDGKSATRKFPYVSIIRPNEIHRVDCGKWVYQALEQGLAVRTLQKLMGCAEVTVTYTALGADYQVMAETGEIGVSPTGQVWTAKDEARGSAVEE